MEHFKYVPLPPLFQVDADHDLFRTRQVSTSNGAAQLVVPASHIVTWDTESHSKVAGRVASREVGVESGKINVGSSNALVSVTIA
jgi:hypothetical protein